MQTSGQSTGPFSCQGVDPDGVVLTFRHEPARVCGPLDSAVWRDYVIGEHTRSWVESLHVRAAYQCPECRMVWLEERVLGLWRHYTALPPIRHPEAQETTLVSGG